MVKFLLLDFLLLLFCTRVRCCEKEDDASAARESAFRGRYTRDDRITRNYEIVVPRKVMIDGRFISYQIPHHYKRSHYRNRRREKMTPDDIVHYRVAIDGQEHHLEMYPNHKLFGPGAVLETRNSETGQSAATGTEFLKDTKMRRLRDTECHYHGNVRDHDGNSALSTCYGLAGYIRTKRGLYMIEPLDGHDFTKDIEHPHIVYKRNDAVSEEDGRPLCNVTSKFEKQISRLDFPRQKRDSCNDSKSYTIELLVVLDKTLLTYHKDFDVENYVLTLFNMASGLFEDSSLGVQMELVIVRIIRLEVEADQMNLSVNKDAETTLKYFQEWQQKMNPGDDTHPNHHDCAVLLTKIDICLMQSLCGFTGTSTIGGTCDPLNGAALVSDNGLKTGYSIAHQIGHT
ncbi:A disintegrin and metalloproteinase with thrombospondin motifs 12-like isoform X2 [Athalia rosae]|uniref:A disintegrin and metalloproteinase with thrombospondin motifs 12-like isoform X2 n=1 Tax=Athalia rosae TaxID=37344 RepID=UPI00203371D4|nr:A disintegrin and metalloproteinase with thrombospondin motifs 12-like isoform X2 [Athalia rosae]